MKDVSNTYTSKETATLRKPIELYKIWSGATYWYYTSSDIPIEFDGQTYECAALARGTLEYNSMLEVSTMRIQIAGITEPAAQYLAQHPTDIIWVEISRLFIDMDPLEKSVIFIGQIKTVGFKGLQAEVTCVGFEHFLKMPVPTDRYQVTCNHKLFNSKCSMVAASYKNSTAIALSENKLSLTANLFAIFPDGYFTGGFVTKGTETRTIISHSGTTITLAYKMLQLVHGDTVDAYPGCDGRVETCRDKFNNIAHFFGFPFIPDENPTLRVP